MIDSATHRLLIDPETEVPKSYRTNFPDNSRNQNIFKPVKMSEGHNGSKEGTPLKRADGLIIVMDTPKGTL